MIPVLAASKVIQIAESTAKDCGCDEIPIDVDYILDLKGISLIPLRGIGDDGFCNRDFDRIYYDPQMPEVRSRFTVAHELGHCILHKECFQELDLNWSSYQAWLNCLDQIDPFDEREMEKQASIFASHLLIPEVELLRISDAQLSKVKAAIEVAQQKGIAREAIEESARDMLSREIAHEFEVSAIAMYHRLKHSGVNFW